jgi:hypothetical protein
VKASRLGLLPHMYGVMRAYSGSVFVLSAGCSALDLSTDNGMDGRGSAAKAAEGCAYVLSVVCTV